MDNPLRKIIGGGLSFFRSSSTDSAVGIDIGSSAIKVVQVKKKAGKAVLETYGAVALGPYAETDIGKVTNLETEKIILALKEVLKEAGVSTQSSALSIASSSSLVFTLELPAQIKETDFPTIVPTEARKYIPVPITEVTLDWFVLPQKEPSFEEANTPESPEPEPIKKEVLVVATQNDAVTKYQSIVKECGLEAGFFELEIFSAIRANFEHELSPVLLIDFGASKTRLVVVEFGAVKSFHTISRGSAEISDSISKSLNISFKEAEEMKKEFGMLTGEGDKSLPDIIKVHIDYILSEANNALLGYEKKYNKAVSKVILSGGGSLLKGFREIATGNFPMPVEIGSPFSKVGAPVFLEKVLSVAGPEFAIALGLALRKLE